MPKGVYVRKPFTEKRLTKFHASYTPVTESGCWVWDRPLQNNGYAVYMYKGTKIYAHRFIYEMLHGQIGCGMEIDHLCRVRCCVNPAHLEAVTKSENIKRGNWQSAVNARKTHCIRGHEFSYIDKSGVRTCRECRRLVQSTQEYLAWRRANRRKRKIAKQSLLEGAEK